MPIVSVEGRTYPVDIRYVESDAQDDMGFLGRSIAEIERLHVEEPPGDVLCFLPTERDILEAVRRLQRLPHATVLPLFSRLNGHEQARVFASAPGRKIVCTTNVAETSLTVPGVRYVVDSGLARTKRYAMHARSERLPIEPISQANALQRAGRAGRVAPGVCIRLYSETDFSARDVQPTPEIARSNLAGVLLTCLSLGIRDPSAFSWLEPPTEQAWRQAALQLDELGAIQARDDQAEQGASPKQTGWRLTQRGRAMARMPVDPAMAAMLLAGVERQVAPEMSVVAAFLSIQDPRLRPLGEEQQARTAQDFFAHEAGDIATVLAIWEAYHSEPSNAAQKRFCAKYYISWRRMRMGRCDVNYGAKSKNNRTANSRSALPETNLDAIHQATAAGLLGHVMQWDDQQETYRQAGGRQAVLYPSSVFARNKKRLSWLCAGELWKQVVFLRDSCFQCSQSGLINSLGNHLKIRQYDLHYDARQGRVVIREERSWRGLIIIPSRRRAYKQYDANAAQKIFCSQALIDEHSTAYVVIAYASSADAKSRSNLHGPVVIVRGWSMKRLVRQR